MILQELYEQAVAIGIDHDPRGREAVLRDLQRRAKEYDELKPEEREFYDTQSLKNPYADSRILHGSGNEPVRVMLAGIDIEVGEVLLAHHLNGMGKQIDLILSHHPEGTAYANLYAVMHMQSDILHRFGVPINVAEGLMESRAKEVERKLMPVNHTRAVDAARLLSLPLLCLHTPADNMVASYLQNLFEEKQPKMLSDIVDILRDISEYRDAMKNGSGPKILIGSGNRTAGKIFVDMTGGTEGSKDIFKSLSSSGINTIVAMHLSEEHRKEAETNHINVVIAGHISSDNLGMNLLLDKLLGAGETVVLECSGFRRIRRTA